MIVVNPGVSEVTTGSKYFIPSMAGTLFQKKGFLWWFLMKDFLHWDWRKWHPCYQLKVWQHICQLSLWHSQVLVWSKVIACLGTFINFHFVEIVGHKMNNSQTITLKDDWGQDISPGERYIEGRYHLQHSRKKDLHTHVIIGGYSFSRRVLYTHLSSIP